MVLRDKKKSKYHINAHKYNFYKTKITYVCIQVFQKVAQNETFASPESANDRYDDHIAVSDFWVQKYFRHLFRVDNNSLLFGEMNDVGLLSIAYSTCAEKQ
jgi:hypothetical protein